MTQIEIAQKLVGIYHNLLEAEYPIDRIYRDNETANNDFSVVADQLDALRYSLLSLVEIFVATNNVPVNLEIKRIQTDPKKDHRHA